MFNNLLYNEVVRGRFVLFLRFFLLHVHILFSVRFCLTAEGRWWGIVFRWFVFQFAFWWFDQARLIRRLAGLVSKIDLKWFEDVVILFFVFLLRCHDETGTGDTLYRTIASLDDDSLVFHLGDSELSVCNR